MPPYFGLPLDRRSWLLLDLSGGVSHCSWYSGLPIPSYLIRDSSHPGPSFLRVSTWQCQYPAATVTDGTGQERRYRSWLVLSRGTMSWCYQLEWRWKLSSRRQPHGCLLGVSAPLATIDPALGEKILGDSRSNDWHPYRAWDLRCRCFNGPGAFREGLRPLLLRRPPEKPIFGFGRRAPKKNKSANWSPPKPIFLFLGRFSLGGAFVFFKDPPPPLPPLPPPLPPPHPPLQYWAEGRSPCVGLGDSFRTAEKKW